MVKFEHIIEEHKQNDLYSPIEQVSGTREECSQAFWKKCSANTFPWNAWRKNWRISQVSALSASLKKTLIPLLRIIQKRTDMTIKSEKNYLKHIKQSGYRSYHLIIYYTVETINGPKKIQAEIQIRTMAMNFWATIEHSLQYKYKGEMPLHVAERLSNAADAIIALDQEMSSVRDEIMDAQNSSQMQSNLVKDILLSIENLYKISNKREVAKIQDEFLRVFRTKDLQQLARFHRQLDIIAEGYRAQSVSF